jgi:hypothetical protein
LKKRSQAPDLKNPHTDQVLIPKIAVADQTPMQKPSIADPA